MKKRIIELLTKNQMDVETLYKTYCETYNENPNYKEFCSLVNSLVNNGTLYHVYSEYKFPTRLEKKVSNLLEPGIEREIAQNFFFNRFYEDVELNAALLMEFMPMRIKKAYAYKLLNEIELDQNPYLLASLWNATHKEETDENSFESFTTEELYKVFAEVEKLIDEGKIENSEALVDLF